MIRGDDGGKHHGIQPSRVQVQIQDQGYQGAVTIAVGVRERMHTTARSLGLYLNIHSVYKIMRSGR
jgi:hypothetical protein